MEPKVAIVALARKVICILHHLIVNREMFEDEAKNKSRQNKPGRSFLSPEPTIADAIQIPVRAGYAVQKIRARRGIDRNFLLLRIAFMVKGKKRLQFLKAAAK